MHMFSGDRVGVMVEILLGGAVGFRWIMEEV